MHLLFLQQTVGWESILVLSKGLVKVVGRVANLFSHQSMTRVSISREESREMTHFFLSRSGELNLYFSFSSRFSRIWKPNSLSLLEFQDFQEKFLFLFSIYEILRKKSLSLLDFQDLNRKISLSPLDVWDFTHNFSFTSLESNSIFKKNVNFQIMYWKVPGKMLTLIFG